MILKYLTDSIELRDPLIRESWEEDVGTRVSRNRHSTPLITVDGPETTVLSCEILLDRCDTDDSATKSFIDTVNGQYCEIQLFDTWYSAYISANTVPYARRAGFVRVTLKMIIGSTLAVLATQGNDYITTEDGMVFLV